MRHRVQMLLGIVCAWGVLPLEFKLAHSVDGLLTQHVGELEQEAEDKGGVQAVLASRFAKIHRVLPTFVA